MGHHVIEPFTNRGPCRLSYRVAYSSTRLTLEVAVNYTVWSNNGHMAPHSKSLHRLCKQRFEIISRNNVKNSSQAKQDCN